MELMTSGRLNTYLADINEKATEQMLLLVKQMAEREGVTEELKAQDQMLWVQRMNNIRDRATELVNHELIYVLCMRYRAAGSDPRRFFICTSNLRKPYCWYNNI